MRGDGVNPGYKEQGRRRSIPPTALPAPDIEIGLRHPVNYTLPREFMGMCDPVHNRHKKIAATGSLPWRLLRTEPFETAARSLRTNRIAVPRRIWPSAV